MSEYNASSIKSLSFREGVRQRIQMYLGSDDIEGTYQALKEIINNSTDEALAGYGKKIEIRLQTDTNEISVRDYGRGVPFLVKENGENVLVNIYTKAHTGGKFDHSSYRNASGLNGIGGTCVCLSSLKFRVESYRDKKKAIATFYKGELQSYKEEKTTEKNGTYISFIPDPEVFSNGEIGYDIERIGNDIKDISYLYPGVVFTVADENGEQSYCAKNGILDFIKDRVSKPLNKHILHWEENDGTDKVEIAFQWGTDREEAYTFVNGLRVPEHGTALTGAKTAITKTFNSLCDKNFNGDKIRENMCLVMNCQVVNPSFANQTKSKINNASLRTLCSKAFTNALKEMAEKYSSEFENIVSLMEKVDKAEAAATRAREAILNFDKEMSSPKRQKNLNSPKLSEAKKLGGDSILLLVEGESAGGSMARGRQAAKADNIGILKLRGKCINPFTHSLEEVLANEEVKLLCQALGISYGKPLNEKKLRYGKVAICVDADDDGAHIALLILSLMNFLCPEYIASNRMYWLRCPLYKQGENYYYTYEEFVEAERTSKAQIIRVKGLGQLEGIDLKRTMFSPTARRLEPITFEEEGLEMLQDLMGTNVEPRKDFVFNCIDFGGIKIG